MVEIFGAWGRTACGSVYSKLAVRLAAQNNSTQATMQKSIYGRLSLYSYIVRTNARALNDGCTVVTLSSIREGLDPGQSKLMDMEEGRALDYYCTISGMSPFLQSPSHS